MGGGKRYARAGGKADGRDESHRIYIYIYIIYDDSVRSLLLLLLRPFSSLPPTLRTNIYIYIFLWRDNIFAILPAGTPAQTLTHRRSRDGSPRRFSYTASCRRPASFPIQYRCIRNR